MTGNRKVQLLKGANIPNDNEAAALETKRKLCARIDAAASSPSPISTAPQKQPRDEEDDHFWDFISEPSDAEIEPNPKRTKFWSGVWDSSKVLSHDHMGEGLVATATGYGNGVSTDGVIENIMEDDDNLYGLTQEAIIEDSMDGNEGLGAAQRTSGGTQRRAINRSPSGVENFMAHEQINLNDGDRLPPNKNIINISNDLASSSGTKSSSRRDTEYTKGAIDPIRDAPIQRPSQNATERARRAHWASSRAIRGSTTETAFSNTDEELLDIDMIMETQNGTHKVHLGDSIICQPSPISHPSLAKMPANARDPIPGRLPQAQTSGVQYQPETSVFTSRYPDATFDSTINLLPSLATSAALIRPATKSWYHRALEPVYDVPTRIIYKRQSSQSRLEGSYDRARKSAQPKSDLGFFIGSESEEVTRIGSPIEGSESLQLKKALSHQAHRDPKTNMGRTKSAPSAVPAPDVMAGNNMFPKTTNGIRSQPKGVPMVKESERIFKDLGFFFFPDNDVNKQRSMRIQKAMEYGARFVHPWQNGESVTHIIVDDDMNYEDVLKHLRLETLPEEIVIVNQRYPSDCISNRILVDPKQKLYDVIRRRPLANSGKLRHAPSEEPLVVEEISVRRDAKASLGKQDAPKVACASSLQENRVESDHSRMGLATSSAQKVASQSKDAQEQKIACQLKIAQEQMAKYRKNTTNAKNAISRSDAQWEKEMGIDDPELITNIRAKMRTSLETYEKNLSELENLVARLESQLAAPDQSTVVNSESEFMYDDSFCAIIEEAKAVAHLPVDSDSEDESSTTSSDYASDTKQSEDERPAKRPKIAGNSAFQCMEKHDGTSTDSNPNAHTIGILEQMSKYYEGLGDQWRPRAYRMAIKTLGKEARKIVSKDDAMRLPFIGNRLAAKIEEIALTDRLRKLDNAKLDPMDKALKTLMGIYGVGLSQASRWVNEGHRSLADLRSNNVKLTANQRVGIDHYEDLQQHIPRTEVAEHGRVVKEALAKFDPAFVINIMGSYRRGASNSGDIDLIITKPGVDIQHIRHTVVGKLIPALLKSSFLKASLATGDEHSGSKWHGCSCLPGSTTWRRIDFLMVPYDEMGAALIYFTGNDIFNRSMRLLASKKGMKLNQRGLYRNVMRGKAKLMSTKGELVESKDEKKIFAILGVPYRPPEHRIC